MRCSFPLVAAGSGAADGRLTRFLSRACLPCPLGARADAPKRRVRGCSAAGGSRVRDDHGASSSLPCPSLATSWGGRQHGQQEGRAEGRPRRSRSKS